MRLTVQILLLSVSLAASQLLARQDSIVMGAQYADQVWFSLGTGASTSAPQAVWDLGFEITSQSGMTASVMINEGKGAQVYVVPGKTIDDWATIDTTGLSTWTPLHNDPTTWAEGALNQAADENDDFDFGWGRYNIISHQVLGTNVFIYKTTTHTRKLRIDGLISGEYKFTYANLDGTDEHSGSVTKSANTGKAFGYWSMETHEVVDREPLLADWDITMLKYVDLVPAGPGTMMHFGVTGILSSPLVRCAKVISETPASAPAPGNDEFLTSANVIGWDWKTFIGGSFKVTDSIAYFVRTSGGGTYRIVFTGFTGSSSGITRFNTEVVAPSNVQESAHTPTLLVYPNVIDHNASVEIATSLSGTGTIRLVDVSGTVVRSIDVTDGFTARRIHTDGLASGIYTVVLEGASGLATGRIIVQ